MQKPRRPEWRDHSRRQQWLACVLQFFAGDTGETKPATLSAGGITMISDIKCDQCGGPATILRCTPICRDDDPFADNQYKPFVTEISCKIKCPNCGQRLQQVNSVAI